MGSQHAPRESPNGPNEMLFNMPRISDFQFALLLFFHRHQQRLRRIFFGAPRSIRRSDDDAQDTVIGPREPGLAKARASTSHVFLSQQEVHVLGYGEFLPAMSRLNSSEKDSP